VIFTSINQMRETLQWLAWQCTLPHFAAFRMSNYEYDALEKKASYSDDQSLVDFLELFFDAFKLTKPQWTMDIAHQDLPAMALIPNEGIRLIIEREADGAWRSDSVGGVRTVLSFPYGTRFASLKSQRISGEKQGAKAMFKAIAMEQKPILFHAALASLSINLLALGTSFYSMQIYDRVIPTQGTSTLIALSIGVIIAISLEMILKLSRSAILDHASQKMDLAYSHNIFHRFLNIRADALPRSVGTLSGQLQGYGAIRAFISSAALYLVVDFPFSLLFLGVIVMIAGWMMGLISLLFLIVSIITGTIFRKKIELLSTTSSMASHKKLGLLVETVENAENIKATGGGWNILSRWNALTEEGIYDDLAIRHYSEMSTYMAAFFQQLSYTALVGIGAYLVSISNTLTMGGLIATTILSGRVLSPIAMLPSLLVQWGKTKIALKDLENVYALDNDNEGVRPLSPIIHDGHLQAQQLFFGYGKNQASIQIEQLSIRQGERVAIVGAIGSGKSTLLKMLSGLYKPQKGQVLINGVDMHHISRNRLVETIGYLPQMVKLLSGTLRDNLTMGLVGIQDDHLLEAAKQSGLIHLINTLPQGLDTHVPEGGESVSGGQKQLIALTRMFLLSPKIWLLDEPTANMDDLTERAILKALHGALGNDKTLIVVTHKPALIGLVGRIIVMGPKGIILDGPRDTVLQQLQTSSQGAQ